MDLEEKIKALYDDKGNAFLSSRSKDLNEHGITEGYKLHVSVDIDDYDRFFDAVYPVLRGSEHKFSKPTLRFQEREDSQRGKILTIYTKSRRETLDFVKNIDEIFKKYGMKPGPLPPNEIPIGDSHAITYGYRQYYGEDLVRGDARHSDDDIRYGRAPQLPEWAESLESSAGSMRTRRDVYDGKAKIGDNVVVGTDGNFALAEIVQLDDENPNTVKIRIAKGASYGESSYKIMDVGLDRISNRPYERMHQRFSKKNVQAALFLALVSTAGFLLFNINQLAGSIHTTGLAAAMDPQMPFWVSVAIGTVSASAAALFVVYKTAKDQR